MAQSPADAKSAAPDPDQPFDVETYSEGWRQLNRAMRADEPWSGDERNVAFVQGRLADGSLAMVDAGPLFGLDDPGDGRSAARVDIDFDGDEDLVLTARTFPRVRVLQNRAADTAEWIGVRLEAESSNPEALGAVVRFEIPGPGEGVAPRVLRRARRAGSGYLAQSSPWLRAAIGPRVDGGRAPRARVVVRWPGADGAVEDFGELRAGSDYVLVEGTGRARRAERSAPALVDATDATAETEPVPEVDRRRAVLPAPVTVPSFAVRSADGEPVRIFGATPSGPRSTGRPVGVLVLDSAQGLETVGALADAFGSLLEFGAQPVLLDVAAPELDPDGRRAFTARARAAGWSGDVLFAAEPEARTLLAAIVGWRFDATYPPAPPWSFLFGPDGRLSVVRVGPLRAGDVVRDLADLASEGEERTRFRAVLSPGQWLEPPTEANLGPLRVRLERAGLEAAVRELELSRIRIERPTEVSADLALRIGRSALAQERPDVVAAIDAFSRATAAEPDNVLAWRGLGYALHLDGSYGDAFEAWSRALELEPDDVNSLWSRGLAAVAAGRFDEAEADAAQLDGLGSDGAQAAARVRAALERAREGGGDDR